MSGKLAAGVMLAFDELMLVVGDRLELRPAPRRKRELTLKVQASSSTFTGVQLQFEVAVTTIVEIKQVARGSTGHKHKLFNTLQQSKYISFRTPMYSSLQSRS